MSGGATRGQVVQRWLLGVVLAALVGVMAVATWSFVWPSAVARGEFMLGQADGFAPGTVTSYAVKDDRLRLLPAGNYGEWPSGYPADGRQVFHVVRLPDGELRVLSAEDQYFGWTVIWYPLFEPRWLGEYRGVFAEPRRGSVWTVDGSYVWGPVPRGLDLYEFRIRGDGVLVVDVTSALEGRGRTSVRPAPYDVTSEGWATSGWPSQPSE